MDWVRASARARQLVFRGSSSTTCAAPVRNMDRLGVSWHVAMKISGHKTESMYQRYGIVSESDLRAAAEKTLLYIDTLPTERVLVGQDASAAVSTTC
jgi:hypothetical protein